MWFKKPQIASFRNTFEKEFCTGKVPANMVRGNTPAFKYDMHIEMIGIYSIAIYWKLFKNVPRNRIFVFKFATAPFICVVTSLTPTE